MRNTDCHGWNGPESGYRVLEAESPGEAMELARQNPDIRVLLKPSAICRSCARSHASRQETDMVMPEMGGPELADAIGKICSGIKVVFMSGYLDLPKAGGSPSAPEVDHLQKPFDVPMLATILRRALDRK